MKREKARIDGFVNEETRPLLCTVITAVTTLAAFVLSALFIALPLAATRPYQAIGGEWCIPVLITIVVYNIMRKVFKIKEDF